MRRTWSKERVVEAIRQRQTQGLPMTTVWREDKAFYSAAKSYFGSWRKAVMAEGTATCCHRTWTIDRVLENLRSRQQQGLSMTSVRRDDHSLYSAAERHFGSWSKAMLKLGVNPPPRRLWTKASVLQAIQRRHEQGLSLKNVCVLDKSLYAAAYRRFGDWHTALQAASLECTPQRKWSNQRILDELRAWYRLPNINLRREDKGLAGAAYRYFGGLSKARKAAGVEPPVKKWSKPRVIEAIQDRYVQCGTVKDAPWNEDRPLALAAKEYFGSWADALVAAGLLQEENRPVPKRRWTRDDVLDAIHSRRQQGLPITGVRDHATSLFYAALRHFGSWRKALTAAGLEWTPYKQWSAAEVVEAIRSRQQRHLQLTNVTHDHPALSHAAKKHFGSWGRALAAAGIRKEDA